MSILSIDLFALLLRAAGVEVVMAGGVTNAVGRKAEERKEVPKARQNNALSTCCAVLTCAVTMCCAGRLCSRADGPGPDCAKCLSRASVSVDLLYKAYIFPLFSKLNVNINSFTYS